MANKHLSTGLLSKKLDGMLKPSMQWAWVEEHLDSCPDCSRRMDRLANVKAQLAALPAPEEGWVIKEPTAPVFVPVPRAVGFPQWAARVGALASVVVVSLLVLRPATAPMRIISTHSSVLTSEGYSGSRVEPDATLRTLPQGRLDVDVEIPNQLLLRLKPGTTLTWQQINKPLLNRRPHVVVNLMRGEILARTKDGFWGSQLEVRTPTAHAFVKGTAFSVNADPRQDATQLKVLAGSVFLSPHLGSQVGVDVNAGQSSQIQGQRLPGRPTELSASERLAMLEAYRIGQEPLVELVIGGGPERVEELLQPAILYMSDQDRRIHPFLKATVDGLNRSILEGDLPQHQKEVKILETVLKVLDDPKVALALRLYVAACQVRLGDPIRARDHFQWVAQNHSQDSLASLSLAAVGLIEAEYLKDRYSATRTFQQLVKRYPHSPEAAYARKIP